MTGYDEPTLPGMPDEPQWTDLPDGTYVTRWNGPPQLCKRCTDDIHRGAQASHPLPAAWLVSVGSSWWIRTCTPHTNQIVRDQP